MRARRANASGLARAEAAGDRVDRKAGGEAEHGAEEEQEGVGHSFNLPRSHLARTCRTIPAPSQASAPSTVITVPRPAAPGTPNVTAANGVMKPAAIMAMATPFSAVADSFVRSL